jgi:hypothetical protein
LRASSTPSATSSVGTTKCGRWADNAAAPDSCDLSWDSGVTRDVQQSTQSGTGR